MYKIKHIGCLKTEKSRLVVDCGFNVFTNTDINNVTDFAPGQVVATVKKGGSYTLHASPVINHSILNTCFQYETKSRV